MSTAQKMTLRSMGPWKGQGQVWENENTIQPDETRWVYLHSSGDPRLPGVSVHSEEDLQLRVTSNGKRRKARKMQLSQSGQMNTHLNFISRLSACLLQQACTSKGTGDTEKNKKLFNARNKYLVLSNQVTSRLSSQPSTPRYISYLPPSAPLLKY